MFFSVRSHSGRLCRTRASFGTVVRKSTLQPTVIERSLAVEFEQSYFPAISKGDISAALQACKGYPDNVSEAILKRLLQLWGWTRPAQHLPAFADLLYQANERGLQLTQGVVMQLGQFCIATQQLVLARKLLSDMEKVFNIPMTLPSYTQLITACVGDVQAAKAAFDEMLSRGMRPDIFAFNALINAYASVGQFQAAKTIVDEMEAHYKVQPDVVSFGTLFKTVAIAFADLTERHRHYAIVLEMMSVSGIRPNALIRVKLLRDGYPVPDFRKFVEDTILNDLKRCGRTLCADFVSTLASRGPHGFEEAKQWILEMEKRTPQSVNRFILQELV